MKDLAPASALDAPPSANDLSAEIILSLDKAPYDRLTCRRIFGNYYRCNWWAPEACGGYDNPSMEGLTVTTHRVRKSRFLTATKTAGGLVVSELKQEGRR
jgi:hypothetical protein